MLCGVQPLALPSLKLSLNRTAAWAWVCDEINTKDAISARLVTIANNFRGIDIVIIVVAWKIFKGLIGLLVGVAVAGLVVYAVVKLVDGGGTKRIK